MLFQLDVGYKPRKDPRSALPTTVPVFAIAALATFVALALWAPSRMDDTPRNAMQDWVLAHGLDFRVTLRIVVSLMTAGVSAWVAQGFAMDRASLREPFRQLDDTQPRLYYGHEARDDLLRRLSEEAGRSKPKGFYLAPHLGLPRAAELKNILLVGAPNSGKSNLARALTDQAIARNDRVLLLCNKGDVTQSFSSEEAVLIAAHHADSHAWDLAADITDQAAALQFATDIVPASNPPFWSDCARLVLTDAIMALIAARGEDWDARDLLVFVSQESDTLRGSVAKLDLNAGPLLQSSDPDEDDRTVSGILLTMRSAALTNLRPLAWAWSDVPRDRRFSIKRWLSDDGEGPRTVVMQFSPEYAVISTLVVGGLIRRTATLLADPRLKVDPSRRAVLVLDEFHVLPKPIESLAHSLAVGREKGLVVVLGIQSVSQVISTYGREQAAVLLDLFQIKIYGRLVPGNSAQMIAQWIGQREISALLPNRTPTIKDKRKVVEKISTRDVFGPGRLTSELGVFTGQGGIAVVRGLVHAYGQCYRIDWPLTTWHKQREGFVPAPWLLRIQTAQESGLPES